MVQMMSVDLERGLALVAVSLGSAEVWCCGSEMGDICWFEAVE